MPVVTFLVALFKGLAAIPQILKYLQEFAAQISAWYMQYQTNDTLSRIADAAAFASRAKTDEERYEAAKKWQDALRRDRLLP